MKDKSKPYLNALVIGGKSKFVHGTLKDKLSMYGIVPKRHIDMEETSRHTPPTVPADCDVVVLFGEMISDKNVTGRLQAHAKEVMKPVLKLSRHGSQWPEEMKYQGFEPINPNKAEALRESEPREEVELVMAASNNSKDIPVTIVETPAPPSHDSFAARMDRLVSLIREMRDKDGVHTIMWGSASKLTVERTQKVERGV